MSRFTASHDKDDAVPGCSKDFNYPPVQHMGMQSKWHALKSCVYVTHPITCVPVASSDEEDEVPMKGKKTQRKIPQKVDVKAKNSQSNVLQSFKSNFLFVSKI